MNDVAVNFERVHQRILNACRVVNRSDPPTLIAVSKMQPSECIEKVYNHGQRDFGENYVQELLEKSKTLKEKLPGIRFHFIGHLQTNKVKSLLAHVYAIHSVDSLKLLQEINKQAGIAQIQMKIYIQVNIDDEPSKGGFSIQELETVCKKISDCTHVIPSGLMCIPSPDREPKISFSIGTAIFGARK